MIPVIVLGVVVMAQLGVIVFMSSIHSKERQALTAAALQANNLPDAARRVDHAAEKRRADAHLKLVNEIKENGGVFEMPETQAQKPLGV